ICRSRTVKGRWPITLLLVRRQNMAADDHRSMRWSRPIASVEEERSVLDSMTPPPRIEIDEALRNGWFEMWYQPKIDLKRKCLAGAGALARIRHPRFGVLPPSNFLPGSARQYFPAG